MSVLTACQSAFIRLVGRKPTTVFSSTDQLEVEIAELATDVAIGLMKRGDWRALTKIHSLTGDGTTTAFDLPADYDRMVLAQKVADGTNWLWGYTRVENLDDWITVTTSGFTALTPGWWIILEGQMQFFPAPASGAVAKFPYISNYIAVQPTMPSPTPAASFSTDADTFKLEDRLLTLGLIWRWRQQKRMEYAEDFATYETALSESLAHDKGARVLTLGRRRMGRDIGYAWPFAIGSGP